MHPSAKHEVIVTLFTQLIGISEWVKLGITCFRLSFGGYPASSLVKGFEHPLAELISRFFVGLYLGFGVGCLRTLARAHEPVFEILAFCEAYHLLLESKVRLRYHRRHLVSWHR
jgi:hypothetical protein